MITNSASRTSRNSTLCGSVFSFKGSPRSFCAALEDASNHTLTPFIPSAGIPIESSRAAFFSPSVITRGKEPLFL